MNILITVGIGCVALSILATIGALRAAAQERREFRVMGITRDRRSVDLKGAALAIEIARSDAPIEREYEVRVRDNISMRQLRAKLAVVARAAEPTKAKVYVIRRQAG